MDGHFAHNNSIYTGLDKVGANQVKKIFFTYLLHCIMFFTMFMLTKLNIGITTKQRTTTTLKPQKGLKKRP